jgi:hypothetical protein
MWCPARGSQTDSFFSRNLRYIRFFLYRISLVVFGFPMFEYEADYDLIKTGGKADNDLATRLTKKTPIFMAHLSALPDAGFAGELTITRVDSA